MPSYVYNGNDEPIAREDDGTERRATPRQVLDHFQGKDANETGFNVVRRTTEGR